MASSNIKLFDENKGNMLNDTEFNISTQRLNGLQTGVASSQLQNKAMYQASLVAYAIAQMMLANGQNANDTDAVSTFVNNFLASIVQKKLDKATKQDVVDGAAEKWISSELLKSNNEDIAKTYLKLAGGTMSGDLFLNADPTSALQAATKRYIDSNFMKLEVAKYTGSGSVGELGATVVTFPYPIKVFVFPKSKGEQNTVLLLVEDLPTDFSQKYRVSIGGIAGSNYMYVKRSIDCRTISWYAQDTEATAAEQLNAKGVEYRHMYAGYYDDSYGPVDRLITASGTFVVEKTGKYYIELYGGGGGGHVLGDDTKPTSIASGGSSCQSYSGVQLNKGEVINVVIGAGGAGSNSSHSPGANGGTTNFGSLSVAGGGGGSKTAGGTGSGNLGKNGTLVANPSNGTILDSTVSDGIYGADYGYGGGIEYSVRRFEEQSGGTGAVFIRYEGQ